jgi:hypothetical protein
VRKTTVALLLGVTLLGIKASSKASKKSIALESRYSDNFTSVWTALNALQPIITANNAAFLGGLSKLPHQVNDNGSDFDSSDFTGLVNAVNNLQSNLQNYGFES